MTTNVAGQPLKGPVTYRLYDVTGPGQVVLVFEGEPSDPEKPLVEVPAKPGTVNKWVMEVVAEGMVSEPSNVAEADINKGGKLR